MLAARDGSATPTSEQEPPAEKICNVCFYDTKLVRVYGGRACRACVAFFIRAARRKELYMCKQNPAACDDQALNKLSVQRACKKCRFDRCLKEGMKVEYIRPTVSKATELAVAVVDENLVLLSRAVKAIAHINSRFAQKAPSAICGTSESDDHFLTGLHYRQQYLAQTVAYRKLLDCLPVVCELADDVKEQLFRNSLACYVRLQPPGDLIGIPLESIFVFSANNARQGSADPHRFFLFPNQYFDLDEFKFLRLYQTYGGKPTALSNAEVEDHMLLGRLNVKWLLSCRDSLCAKSADFLRNEDDFAAFVLLILIHTNDYHKMDSQWQRPINRLKNVFRELDAHYRAKGREAGAWGNIVMFLSNLQSTFVEYTEAMTTVDLYMRGSIYIKMVKEVKAEECRIEENE